MTRFLLIRHAMVDAVGRRLAGRAAGVVLNEEGRSQARALAERLAGLPIAAVYSSPLERAVQTAEPIATLRGLRVETREELHELQFGEWTGRGFEELAGDARFRRFNSFRSCAPVPGGEFMLQAQARMVVGLDALRARHARETIVVVSHGDLIKAAVAWYAGVPLDLFQRIEVAPASVSVVELGEDGVRIVAVNHAGELAASG